MHVNSIVLRVDRGLLYPGLKIGLIQDCLGHEASAAEVLARRQKYPTAGVPVGNA